jgi:ribonuclease-3
MELEEFNKKKEKIEHATGYYFKQDKWLKLAMIHRSYWNEHQQTILGHNERLEFLGDAVLDLCVAHQLFNESPELAEGDLTQIRSALVDSAACYRYCSVLQIEDCLFLGKGEHYNPSKGKETIVSDFFEALLGAIYLDGGLDPALSFIQRLLQIIDRDSEIDAAKNWKSDLQDYTQKKLKMTPTYQTLEESGPEHAKEFLVAVCLADEQIALGKGSSKKEAQVAAAKIALKTLKDKYHGD